VKTLLILSALLAPSTAAKADEASFRALYKTLVETDTTLATGSCTLAVDRATAAMRAAGFPQADIHRFAAPEHPREGGMVASITGRDATANALLLVAHIDTVPAARADWDHDPFALTEQGGYFHGRGVADNKAMAAALVDSLVRLHNEKYRPRRTIKIALTCGEETITAFNGADYLAASGRALGDAGLVLVPSGGAVTDSTGRKISLALQAGEKLQQNFRVDALGTGSHASRPTSNNAIVLLAGALTRIDAFRFRVVLNPVTRRYLAGRALGAEPRMADAIRALLANPADETARQIVTTDTEYNAMLRTTCAVTTINGGEQRNSVSPRASANVNCRLLPGERVEDVRAKLVQLAADPAISVVAEPPIARATPSPPLTAAVIEPIEQIAHALWPGVRIIPTMLTGTTDARHFNAAGMPAYGVTALFYDPDGSRVHAPNERVRVSAVLESREFLYRLIKRFAPR